MLKSDDMIRTGSSTASSAFSRPGTPSTATLPGSAKFPGRPLVTKKRRYPHYPEAELKVPQEGTYDIVFDHEHIKSFIQKADAKQYLRVKPENLRWAPLFIDPAAPQSEDGQTARIRTSGDRNEPPERLPMDQVPPPPHNLAAMASVDPSLIDPDLRAPPDITTNTMSSSSGSKRPPVHRTLSSNFEHQQRAAAASPPPRALILKSPPKYQNGSSHDKSSSGVVHDLSLQPQKMGTAGSPRLANGQAALKHHTKRPRIPDSESEEDDVAADAEGAGVAKRSKTLASSPGQPFGCSPSVPPGSSAEVSESTEADAEGEVEVEMDAEGEEDDEEGFEAIETTTW